MSMSLSLASCALLLVGAAALAQKPFIVPGHGEATATLHRQSSQKALNNAFECMDAVNFSVLEQAEVVNSTAPQICINERAAPQVYLLGAQKCGTKTLTVDLYSAGLTSARFNQPEIHAFDKPCSFSVPNHQSKEEAVGKVASPRCGSLSEEQINEWSHNFQLCCKYARPYQMKKCVADDGPIPGDMTPINMRLPDLPTTMAGVYGSHSKSLKFLVALRSPMNRLQSGFYHVLQTSDTEVQRAPMYKNFKAYVDFAMEKAPKCDEDSSCRLDESYPLDQLYRSMYAAQLEPWLKTFDASQFIIMPMISYFSNLNTRKKWVSDISKKFDLGLNPNNIQELGCHNSRDHPSLEKDLRNDQLKWLHDYYTKDKQNLGKLLASSIPKGLTLMGYDGSASDDSILDWLSDNW